MTSEEYWQKLNAIVRFAIEAEREQDRDDGEVDRPRFTADIDAVFLLSTEDISHFLELAQAENRVLLLRYKPTGTDIDVMLGMLPFEQELVERSSTKSFANLSIRLPTPEDLIIMKAIAHRPKDLEDIRTIADKHPELDLDRIESG